MLSHCRNKNMRRVLARRFVRGIHPVAGVEARAVATVASHATDLAACKEQPRWSAAAWAAGILSGVAAVCGPMMHDTACEAPSADGDDGNDRKALVCTV